jgi:hypothetical protein
MRPDEISLPPWEEARDWFTPARGTKSQRQDPAHGWPFAEEHRAG